MGGCDRSGAGIGMEDHARLMVENVLKDAYVPIILDADAESRRGYRELTGYFTENIIVTPHMERCRGSQEFR